MLPSFWNGLPVQCLSTISGTAKVFMHRIPIFEVSRLFDPEGIWTSIRLKA